VAHDRRIFNCLHGNMGLGRIISTGGCLRSQVNLYITKGGDTSRIWESTNARQTAAGAMDDQKKRERHDFLARAGYLRPTSPPRHKEAHDKNLQPKWGYFSEKRGGAFRDGRGDVHQKH